MDPRKELGMAKPDILHYTQYRQYLKDWIQEAKTEDDQFSLRTFARTAGFSGHGHLRFILEGERNLTKRSLLKLILALDMPKGRARYFENLVFFNQAKTHQEKNHYYQELVKDRKATAFRTLETAQFEIFSQWHHSAIRELIGTAKFRPHPEWIALQLQPKIETKEAEASLKLLLAAGLIAKTANGYKTVDEAITTDDEVRHLMVENYHRQMLKMAEVSMEGVAPEQRDISSVSFKIRETDFPKLKQQIQLMRKEFRHFAVEDGSGDRVVQINIQLFPLTQAQG
jgi:uncharacterized protein (TIGR02147 family)